MKRNDYSEDEITLMADLMYGEYYNDAGTKARRKAAKQSPPVDFWPAWEGDPQHNPLRLSLLKALRAIEPPEEEDE